MFMHFNKAIRRAAACCEQYVQALVSQVQAELSQRHQEMAHLHAECDRYRQDSEERAEEEGDPHGGHTPVAFSRPE